MTDPSPNTRVALPAGGFSYVSLAPDYRISPLYVGEQFSLSEAYVAPGKGSVDVSAYSFSVLLKPVRFTQYHANGQYAWHGLMAADRTLISSPRNAIKTIWDTPIHALAMFVSHRLVDQFLGSHTRLDELIGDGKYGLDDRNFVFLAQMLIGHNRQQGYIDRILAEDIVGALLRYTMRTYTDIKIDADMPKKGLNAQDIRKIQAYIHDNISQDISVEDLAKVVDITPSHFSRLFKQATGYTPHSYVQFQRVERAKAYLRSGQMTIVQAALAVGFSQQSHFTRVFRQFVGLTPGQFMREWGEKPLPRCSDVQALTEKIG